MIQRQLPTKMYPSAVVARYLVQRHLRNRQKRGQTVIVELREKPEWSSLADGTAAIGESSSPREPKKYRLSDGKRYTVREIMRITGAVDQSCIRRRLSLSSNAEKVLKPIAPSKPSNLSATYTLDDGNTYTLRELAELTGCTRQAIRERLMNGNREARRILKPRKADHIPHHCRAEL